MTVKDILVHVDGEDTTRAGLVQAVALARRFGARLTGLFARREILAAAVVARQPSDTLVAQAEAARAVFERTAKGLATRWWQVMHGGEEDIISEVVFCSHYFDLVVVTQTVAATAHIPGTMIESLILDSGRPILVVPAFNTVDALCERVVIGWRSGKQSSRALHDSLPLIAGARELLVVTLRGLGPKDSGTPPVDVIDHLRAHGLPAVGQKAPDEGLSPIDALLSRAYDVNADLLVIGGHLGRILSLRGKAGANTRHILAHMNLPVLFSC